MSNLAKVVAQALRPLFNETKDGWQIHYIDSYDIEVDKADNAIKINSKFYKDKSVVISDNYWVGIKSDGTEEVIGDAQGNVWHVTERQYLQQVKALGLINSYEFDGPMKHNIIIQPAFQAFLRSKEYVAVRFGGQMTTANCFLGTEGQEIAGLDSFMGHLQALHTNDLGDNEMLFEFQDAWLKDADDQKLDLAWHIIPEPQGNYKFYVEVSAEEILTRNADIIIDPSLATVSAFSHSHHGNGIAAASNGKLAHVFCSDVNAHYVPSARLQMTVSRDDGITWNTPWILVDKTAESYAQYGVGDPTLVGDSQGNLYTLYLVMNGTGATIGAASSELYLRKMAPDDSIGTALRLSNENTPVASYYNDAYTSTGLSGFGAVSPYDVYVLGNTMVIAWWSSSNNLNQSLVIRELDLTTMSLSEPYIVSGLVGSAYGSSYSARASVLIRALGNVAYIGVNYSELSQLRVNFSLVKYDITSHTSTLAFTNIYSFAFAPITTSNRISFGIPVFSVVDEGNSIVAFVYDIWTSGALTLPAAPVKQLSVSDGSVIRTIVAPNFPYTVVSSYYAVYKILPITMPNGDEYWCDCDKMVRFDKNTGDVGAILPSSVSKTASATAYMKEVNKISYENRLFHSFGVATVGYTALGSHTYDTQGMSIRSYMGLWADAGNTQYLLQHSVYIDALNTGHLLLDGKYYRSTNPSTQKPTLADFVYVDTMPQWVQGTFKSAVIYYDHLADNLYIFAITAGSVYYCKRHDGVYTATQTLAVNSGCVNLYHGSGNYGALPDKNGNVICIISVWGTYYELRGEVYKVVVATDEFSKVPVTPVVPNYMIGAPIKNNTGDILFPYMGIYGTGLGLPGYFLWDGNTLTGTAVPAKVYNPLGTSVGLYNDLPFVTTVYMFQDLQGEYYIVYQYLSTETSNPTIFAMTRTVGGVWQSDTVDNQIPLNTDCLGLGLGNVGSIGDGLCKQVFYAMLNPWRNKLIVFMAYREKKNLSTVYVPGLRWLEYDTQTQTWSDIAPVAGYENSVIPVSWRGTKGFLMLQNDYGDPRICFIEGTTSQTNFGTVGKLSIIEIDYTQARISNTAPESPRLRSPLTQTSVYNTVTPALTWYVAPDAQFDNQHYMVELSADPSFSALIGSANSTTDQSNFKWYFGDAELPFPAEGVSSVYGTYENPTMYVIFNVPVAWGLELNTEYYWRVKTIG